MRQRKNVVLDMIPGGSIPDTEYVKGYYQGKDDAGKGMEPKFRYSRIELDTNHGTLQRDYALGYCAGYEKIIFAEEE